MIFNKEYFISLLPKLTVIYHQESGMALSSHHTHNLEMESSLSNCLCLLSVKDGPMLDPG